MPESLRTDDSTAARLQTGERPVAAVRDGFFYGDNEVETVLAMYADMVYRLAFARVKNRYDADDILQEVFLRYVRFRPDFNGEEHRKAWLIRTTINCGKSLLRSAWFRRISPLPDTLAAEMKERSDVYYAVMALPARYRTAVHLFYYEDYSVAEIAALLDVTQSAIKSRLSRARAMLRERLSGVEGLAETEVE